MKSPKKINMTKACMQDIAERLRKLADDNPAFYLQPDLRLGALAKVIGTNRTYLSNYFSVKNTAFCTYLNQMRIEYAKHLININPQIPIGTVGQSCGFSSMPTFRRNFFELCAMTPSAYRKIARKKKLEKKK